MKIFVSHINVYQTAATTEEALNNHINEMTLPVNVSHPLSLVAPVLAQWHHRYVNEVVMEAVMEVTHEPNHMGSPSLRLI